MDSPILSGHRPGLPLIQNQCEPRKCVRLEENEMGKWFDLIRWPLSDPNGIRQRELANTIYCEKQKKCAEIAFTSYQPTCLFMQKFDSHFSDCIFIWFTVVADRVVGEGTCSTIVILHIIPYSRDSRIYVYYIAFAE